MYWRVSVFFVRQRRRRPVGVCLTNPAGSWSRPYENGRMGEVKRRCFSAPRRSQQLTAVLVYVNVFGNFRLSQKKFCVFKHRFRLVIGCCSPNFRVSTNFFLIRLRTSERVIGCLLRNFRVSAKNFSSPNPGHLVGLSDGVWRTLGFHAK